LEVASLDHLVLTVRDIQATCAFYVAALGMRVVTFGQGRTALAFGAQKINLHQLGREFEPKAAAPTPGSADLCFLTATPVEEVAAHLRACGVAVVDGPVERTGATGPIRSVYCRDPDGNLIELANRVTAMKPSPAGDYHLVHANVAHARGPLDSPVMAAFVAQIDEINALARGAAGFVGQPTAPDDGTVYTAPFLLNVSLWESLETLDVFTHQGKHATALERRGEWFVQEATRPSYVLYWVPKGHVVTEKEVRERLGHLAKHGATSYAFTFKQPFPPGS
jgi:catechol 2,3-dioxygenase-like lactoylglutathione lyase family enzyme